MVTRERLNKFIRRRCHEIRRQVREFCTIHNGEALHVLRVEVKRLRAAVVLLQSCSSARHLHTKDLKELYKASGTIRTAQVNLQVLQEQETVNRQFADEQQRVIEEGSIAFCLASSRYRQAVQEVQDRLEEGTCAIKTGRVRSLFQERIAKLSLFFSAPALDTVALHNTRKETKELLYIYALLPPALAASLPLNKDYLEQLQHSLGNWHDNTVTLSLLLGFGQPHPGLIQKLQQTDEALLGEIKTLTTDFDQKISAVRQQETGTGNGQNGPAPKNAAISSSADQ